MQGTQRTCIRGGAFALKRRFFTIMAVLGLCAGHAAQASGTFSGTFFAPGGGVAIGTFTVPPTQRCPDAPPYPTSTTPYDPAAVALWLDCEAKAAELVRSLILGGFGLTGNSGAHSISSSRSISADSSAPRALQSPHVKAAAAANPSLTLNSSTPQLPFLGNPLTVVSSVPNAADPSTATAAYSVLLRRQADCSLVEDFVWPNAVTPNTPNASLIGSLPAAQDYFHQLSGLTTTPDVFAQGCGYPILGQPSSNNILLLGTTSTGAVISAELGGTGVTVSITDTTGNTFTSNLAIPSPSIRAISAADVNADGILDIVTTFIADPATQQPSTAVFLGNADGTFKAGVYYDVPGDIVIDDVNGDGKPDIVICGATPGITTLIGKGDGTFAPSGLSASGLPPCGGGGEMLTSDFNGDGKKDLLVQGIVALGKGDGTFTVGTPVTADTTFNLSSSIAAVAAGDINKDGKADVVISQPGFVAVFYGKGDGTFTAGPRYAALPDYVPVSIVDVDGDGDPDIVLGANTGGIYASGCCNEVLEPPLLQILMGRGDGTFVDSVAYNVGRYGNGPQIATADFNGDGKLDVLTVSSGNGSGSANSIVMSPGDGTGALGSPIASPTNSAPGMVIAADLNNDGKLDAVLAGGSTVSLLINQGAGTFAGELDYTLPNAIVSLVTGDFNGDGKVDVAVGVYPGLGGTGASGVYVLWGQTDGSLAAPVKVDASLNPTGLAAADINGDGKTDLVVADQGFFNYAGGPQQVNGALHVYLGSANGTFTTAASPTTSATNYSVVTLGDMNGDGKVDLIVAGTVAGTSIGAGGKPSIYTLLGNGDGTFQAASASALAGNYGIGTTTIALADINKDGYLDVVAGDSTAFTSVLLGKGDGTLVNSLLALGQQPLAVATADLNGDGFPELLVGTNDPFGSSNLAVFLNANAWTAASTLPATTTTLTSSATSITAGQSLMLTATVAAASGTAVPAGTVTFLDGATTLGTGTLDAGGTATYTTSTLVTGSRSLTASYGGSTSFAGSTSTSVTVAVVAGAPDFTLALSPASGSASAGQSAVTTVTLTPSNGFNQSVSLSCTGLPSGATCSFSPSSITANGSAATSTLTIATAARTAMGTSIRPFDPALPAGVLFAGAGVPLAARRRRRGSRGRRGPYGLAAMCLIGAIALQGCHDEGQRGGGTTGTPAGTYTVTITATAGSTSHTSIFALTVS